MLGRVMSLFALVLLGGTSAGAPVASSLGPRAPFFTGTAAAIAAVAITLGRTRIRPRQAEGNGSTRYMPRRKSSIASVWPHTTGVYAEVMNEIPKVVFATTLTRAEWAESRIAGSGLAEDIGRPRAGNQ